MAKDDPERERQPMLANGEATNVLAEKGRTAVVEDLIENLGGQFEKRHAWEGWC